MASTDSLISFKFRKNYFVCTSCSTVRVSSKVLLFQSSSNYSYKLAMEFGSEPMLEV